VDQFDVIIVGARCAGSPLAMMLARQGLRVCVLDRARFPSDTPSTHIIQACGVDVLARLGVLDAVLAAGAAEIDEVVLVTDDVRIETVGDESISERRGICIRRVTLDALLVDAAAEAGATVRTGSRVTGLLTDDGRVTGVQTDAGPITAQLVVGADGRLSTVASSVGAAEYHVTPPGRMPAWAYYEGVAEQNGRALIGRVGDLAYLASPTDGGLYMAAVTLTFSEQAAFHADRDANFDAGIGRWPELADVVAGARRVGPIRVLTKWHGYFRQSAGPGWVLVGDAGHFKDFSPGQGIADALRQAERLAASIEHGIGQSDLDTALHQWWRWRDHDAYEMYWFATTMGAPGFASRLTRGLLKNVADDAAARLSLFKVLNHEIRPSQLMTPSRALRATARALRDEPRHFASTLGEFVSTAGQARRQARHARVRPPGMLQPAWQAR
jgi:2-polyprenyl-6-methoxyphenol hydroxylase-like FAD-dependent oxidoreductase